MKKSFPLSQVYGWLPPGPVVLVTTAQKGRANVMTLSWLTMMDFEPPRPRPTVASHQGWFQGVRLHAFFAVLPHIQPLYRGLTAACIAV